MLSNLASFQLHVNEVRVCYIYARKHFYLLKINLQFGLQMMEQQETCRQPATLSFCQKDQINGISSPIQLYWSFYLIPDK